MDFALDEEQRLLHDSLRRYVEKEARFDPQHWSQFAQMGWLAAALPEAVGGFGGGVITTSIIAEQLGRGLLIEPFVPVAVLAAQALLPAADSEPARSALGALIDGASRIVPVFGQPTDLHLDSSALRLGGRQAVVVGGTLADRFLVAVPEREGLSLFLIDGDAAGLARQDCALIDGTPACDLKFEGVPLNSNQRVGEPGGAAATIELAHLHAKLADCAQALGVMDRAIEATREHLLQRQQFGVPLASFQVLRHRMADMLIAQEQARAALHGALAALSDGPSVAASRAVAIAKAQSGRSGRFVGAQAIQLHGGMGVSDECLVGHCFKRLVVLDALQGNAATQLRWLAGSLQ